MALRPLYYVREELQTVQVLWNDGEAFIKVGIRRDWISGSVPVLIWRQVAAFVSYEPTGAVDSTALYHIRNGGLERYEFPTLDPAGNLFPCEGGIYYMIGVLDPSEWPAVWRWTGGGFQKLGRGEALHVVNSFKLLDDVVAREGWHEKEAVFDSRRAVEVPFQLSTNGLSLVLSDAGLTEGNRVRSITLKGITSGKKEAVLERTSSAYRRATRTEYWDFARNHAANLPLHSTPQ